MYLGIRDPDFETRDFEVAETDRMPEGGEHGGVLQGALRVSVGSTPCSHDRTPTAAP